MDASPAVATPATQQALRRAVQARTRKPSQLALFLASQREAILLFLPVAAAYLGAAWYAVFVLGIRPFEPALQAVTAWMTLWGARPTFPAMLVTQEPFPAFVALPLNLVPAIRDTGFAPHIVSALAGALTVVVLVNLLRFTGVGRPTRWVGALAFGLTPAVVWAAAAGGAASLGMALTAITALLVAHWYRTEGVHWLVAASFSAGLLTITLVDSVALVLCFAGAIWLVAATRPGLSAGRVSAYLITFLVPVFFIFSLWLMLAWFAVTSLGTFLEYGSIYPLARDAMAQTPAPPLIPANPFEYLVVLLGDLVAVMPLVLAALLAGVLGLIFRFRRTLLATWLILGTYGGYLLLLFLAGLPLPLERAWYLLLPVAAWLIAEVLAREPNATHAPVRAQLGVAGILAIATAVSAAGLLLLPPRLLPGVQPLAAVAAGDPATPGWAAIRDAGLELSSLTEGPILTDLVSTFPLMLASGDPGLFLQTERPLLPPARPSRTAPRAVQAVLVRDPAVSRDADGFSRRYPTFYGLGASFADLLADWSGLGWRLYRVQPGTSPES